MDTSRLLIAVLLSLGLIFAYQELVLKRMYPPPSSEQMEAAKLAQEQNASPGATASGAPLSIGAAPPGSSPSIVSAGALPPATPAQPERIVTIDTDLYVAQVTTRGARIKSFRLKRYHETSAPDSALFEMVPQSGEFILPLGAILNRGDQLLNDSALEYSTAAPDNTQVAPDNEAKLVLDAHAADGTTIEKTLDFHGDSYAFTTDLAVTGGPKNDAIGFAISQPLNPHLGYYDIPELQADVQDKAMNEAEKALRKGVEPITGNITYAGFGDRYFLTAYLPANPSVGTLMMSFVGNQALARMLFPGTSELKARVYMGPKLLEALEGVDPSLHKSIDFGWAGLLAIIFLRALKMFHVFVPNYGWDIILVTVAIRILLLPISIRSQRSMMRMQRLQPQITRLREKFKDDQERQQREMMDLYKRNHVNPIGGCLPMVLQLPMFIGLYEALLNSVELRHAPFILWIRDLSAPDCLPVSGMPQLPLMHCHGIPVLVLLMGASTFLQQWMTPTSPDPNQQRMMMLTPIIFTIMFVNFPAGLSLYYFASNVLGVIQQVFLNREFKNSPVTA
ncbi:MAG: membrane protein insertase YidC [Candidatus Binataceae bacterium]